MLSGKKIVVTGSAGFIGARLVRRLKQEHAEVIEVDIRAGIDLTDWEIVRHVEKFDLLYHLAAKTYVPESYLHTRDFYFTNVVSTMNMLELCRIHQAKMIFASSYVYGTPHYLPIDEQHPVAGYNPYAQSKIIGENLCQGYHRDHDSGILIFRQSNIYGPGLSSKFLIPTILEQAETGKIVLNDPAPRRDFIHVDDLVEAYINGACYERAQYEIFNIGAGKSHSIRDVAAAVVANFRTPVFVEFSGRKRQSEVPDTVFNIEKAMKLLNWKPRISLADGLQQMIRDQEKVPHPELERVRNNPTDS